MNQNIKTVPSPSFNKLYKLKYKTYPINRWSDVGYIFRGKKVLILEIRYCHSTLTDNGTGSVPPWTTTAGTFKMDFLRKTEGWFVTTFVR